MVLLFRRVLELNLLDKSLLKMPKIEATGQTLLPDNSILIGQKLMENTKVGKVK